MMVCQTFGSILAHRNNSINGRDTLLIYQKLPSAVLRDTRKHSLLLLRDGITFFYFWQGAGPLDH